MKRFLLVVIIFLSFLFESIFVELYSAEKFGLDRMFVPRFMFVFIMLISLFYSRNKAIIYGICFGLLFDMIYTDMLGVYMFSIPIIVYIMSYTNRILHSNLIVTFFVVLVGITLLEWLVYGIYYLVQVSELNWKDFVYDRLIPTLVLNQVFFIIVYYPMTKFLAHLRKTVKK